MSGGNCFGVIGFDGVDVVCVSFVGGMYGSEVGGGVL